MQRLLSFIVCCYSTDKQKKLIVPTNSDDPRRYYIYSGIHELNLRKSIPLIIADFGSSHGRHSIQTMKIIIEYLKILKKLYSPPLVIHNDLPTNDWTKVFHLLTEDNSYKGLANGCSFYKQCLPPNCLSIGFSSAALHILSEKPCNILDHCYIHFANKKERELFKSQARSDFELFIQSRSRELRSGGILILNIPSTAESEEMNFNFYFDLLYRCVRSLELLTSKELIDFTIPFYLRSLLECVDVELFNRYSLKLVKSELVRSKLLIFDEYRNGNIGIDDFSKSLTMLMKPGTDFALKNALRINQRTNQEIESISTEFWSLFEQEVQKEVHPNHINTWTTYLVLKKR